MSFCVGVCFELLRLISWLPVLLFIVVGFFVVRWILRYLRREEEVKGSADKP